MGGKIRGGLIPPLVIFFSLVLRLKN